MSIAGQVSRVEVRPRGSSLVAGVASGATQVTVDDPTPFVTSDSRTVLVGDDVRTYTALQLVVAPPDLDGNPRDYAVLTLDAGLSAAAIMGTPVSLLVAGQVPTDVRLWVDQFTPEAQPVPVVVSSPERDKWTAYEGIVDPPIPGSLSDDLTSFTADPGWAPAADARSFVVDEDGTTVPEAIAAAAQSGGDGTPTTAPDSSPTPRPYQDSGTVAVDWDPPAVSTHVRMYLAPAITNSDGSGTVDTSVTPGPSNLYSDNVQPVARVSSLTLGGLALDPKKQYQVALGAWNEVGDAPVSPWVLCQPGLIAAAVITYLVLAEQINANGLAIATSASGQYDQPFTAATTPAGWTLYQDGSATDRPVVEFTSSGTPTGTNGAALHFTPSTGSTHFGTGLLQTSNTVGDFEVNSRVRLTRSANNGTGQADTNSTLMLGARATTPPASTYSLRPGVGVEMNLNTGQVRVTSAGTGSTIVAYVAPLNYDPNVLTLVPDVWYRVRYSIRRGIVTIAVWDDRVSEPVYSDSFDGQRVGVAKSSTAVTYASGPTYIKWDSSNTQQAWVDYFNVTAYTTGFQVLPDATGDWPQVLDPIRTKNTQQDGRLSTNEGNIAANTTATQTNASAITAVGNRVTALEARKPQESVSTANVSPSTATLAVTGISVTFTVGSTSEVWAVELYADVNLTTAGATNITEVLMDGGTPSKPVIVYTRGANTTRADGAKRRLITGLSAGSHTVTAQTRMDQNSGSATVFAGTSVIVERVF